MIPNGESVLFHVNPLDSVVDFKLYPNDRETSQWTSVSVKDTTLSTTEELNKLCANLGCSLENLPLVSGGVQQYLNRMNMNKHSKAEDIRVCVQTQPDRLDSPVSFSSLPVYVKLHLFSFLDAKDLCLASGVNREWLSLTSDNVLWNNLLQTDMVHWSVIGHMTNPMLYREVDSDWSNKEIYLQCCPKVRKLMKQENFAFMNISTMLRSFLPRKVPKIAMFGPGLESSTSGIVRKILYEKSHQFEVKQLFPGQFEGVGSGMTLQMKSGLTFDLTVLYSSTRLERENRGGNRMERNRLIQRNIHQMEEGENEAEGYELTQAVRDLCRTLDAFIYVVDATAGPTEDNLSNSELVAMVNERWSATHVPVLVLSCVQNSSVQRLACVNVVDRLQLNKLDKPWQVHDCEVENLFGVVEAIQWVIEQSQRR